MVLGVDDAAKEFGKTLGGQAALGLCKWLQRLWDAEGVCNRKKLQEIVEPAFAKFQAIYQDYAQSFQAYRTQLSNADSEQVLFKLVNQIEADLRFTAKDRVDLLSQLKQAKGSILEGFVTSMAEFLVSNESSLSGTVEDALAPPEIANQVMRRGLIADLRTALASPWAAALDPAASAPPLRGEALERRLEELGVRHGIAKTDPDREAKLRLGLAIDRLDARVDMMVAAYKRVREEYELLKGRLSASK